MSFATFARQDVRAVIERFGSAKQMTAMVGAGSSVEVQLPDWEELIRRLLRRAAEERGLFMPADTSGDALRAWIAETLRADTVLGAASVADAMSQGRLATWLPEVLFEPKQATDYLPGPTSRAVARLKAIFQDDLDIITTNYDDLIEVALRQQDDIGIEIVTFTGDFDALPAGPHAKVTHPHGYVGRDGIQGELVVSEEEYHQIQAGGSWQEKYVGGKLSNYPCLFLGAGLRDPNLLRWIYGYAGFGQRHAIVFVRQAQPPGLEESVRDAREQVVKERWEHRSADAVFVDHFADVAHLVNEIAYRRTAGADYRPMDIRAAEIIRLLEDQVIGAHDDEVFRVGQEALHEVLREALRGALLLVQDEFDVEIEGDWLAMSLWLADRTGDKITMWASTDRLHFDRETIQPVDLEARGKWVAVKTVCRGLPVAEARHDRWQSRWRYISGVPLSVKTSRFDRLPIGCLTITSMKGKDETILGTMGDDVLAEFHRSLVESVSDFLVDAAEATSGLEG